MKNRKPIEAKESNIEYIDFFQARDELKRITEAMLFQYESTLPESILNEIVYFNIRKNCFLI